MMRLRNILAAVACSIGLVAAPGSQAAPPADDGKPEQSANSEPEQRVSPLQQIIDRGTAHMQAGRTREAADEFRRAYDIAVDHFGVEHENTATLAMALSFMLSELGDYDAAAPLQEQMVSFFERTRGVTHFDTLRAKATLLLSLMRQGRYAEADRLGEELLEQANETLGPDNEFTLMQSDFIADALVRRGRSEEAEEIYRRLVDAWERRAEATPDDSLFYSLMGLASSFEQRGELAEAELILLDAIERSDQVFGPRARVSLDLRGDLASVYMRQRRRVESEALLQEVIRIAEAEDVPDERFLLNQRNALAMLYRSSDESEAAEPLFLEIIADSERVDGANHPDTLTVRANLAFLYQEIGRLEEARELLMSVNERRLALFPGNHPRVLTSARGLARNYLMEEEFAEAERLFERVSRDYTEVRGATHIATLRSLSGLVQSRIGMGNRANAVLEPARQLVTGLRARRADQVDNNRFAEAQAARERDGLEVPFSLMAQAAHVAAEAGVEQRSALTPEVFTALQDSMAGTANRAIVRMAIRRFADSVVGEGLGALVREREALSEQWIAVNELYSLALSDTSPSGNTLRDNVRAERDALVARMDQIDTQIRESFPDYFALIRPEAVDIAATQAFLAEDEAVIVAVPSAFGLHVVTVTRDAQHWHRSDWDEEQVVGAVNRLRWDVGATVEMTPEQLAEWQAAEEEGAPLSYDRDTAYALYRELLAPAEDVLSGKQHLFVAAGGALSAMPFSLLVAEAPAGEDDDPDALRNTAWLAERFALTHIPSVQSLRLMRRFQDAARAAGGGFAGFGDPALQGRSVSRGLSRGGSAIPSASAVLRAGATRSAGGIANVAALRSMARLPGTAIELENMRRTLGAPEESVRLAEEATETAVKSADLSNARIIAFATHGIMAGEIDDFVEPGLVLTPPDQATEEDDGYLAASEVSALRLDADWVILSACNTAAGDGGEGSSGLSGLARAFFYAGARNLLASYWPVNDDVAGRLTVRTIELRRDNPDLSRADAFRRAMREVREETGGDASGQSWAHPAYWAPFALIGDGAN